MLAGQDFSQSLPTTVQFPPQTNRAGGPSGAHGLPALPIWSAALTTQLQLTILPGDTKFIA